MITGAFFWKDAVWGACLQALAERPALPKIAATDFRRDRDALSRREHANPMTCRLPHNPGIWREGRLILAHPLAPEPDADEIVSQLFRHTRYLLTLKGRPPFRLAGIETYERLGNVASFSLELLAQRYEPRLAQLYQGLQAVLAPFAQTHQELQQGAAWLRDIA